MSTRYEWVDAFVTRVSPVNACVHAYDPDEHHEDDCDEIEYFLSEHPGKIAVALSSDEVVVLAGTPEQLVAMAESILVAARSAAATMAVNGSDS